MGLAVERLPLTLHWKKLYISGRSNDNDNLLGIDYGSSHIVALQRSSERRKTKQGEERCQPFPLLTDESKESPCDFYTKQSLGYFKYRDSDNRNQYRLNR